MNKASLTYSEVESTIEEIISCRDKMQAIFNDFNREVVGVTSTGSFEGNASETFKGKYDVLSKRFDDYCRLIDEFARRVRGAKEREQYTFNLLIFLILIYLMYIV